MDVAKQAILTCCQWQPVCPSSANLNLFVLLTAHSQVDFNYSIPSLSAAAAQLTDFHSITRNFPIADAFINSSLLCILQVHTAEQEQRIPEDLLGVVSRVREVQVGVEDVGDKEGGKSIFKTLNWEIPREGERAFFCMNGVSEYRYIYY